MKHLTIMEHVKIIVVYVIFMTLTVLIVLALSGCVTTKYNQVRCASGFNTPPSFLAYAHGGYVIWRETKNSALKKKRVVSNDSCQMIKVSK